MPHLNLLRRRDLTAAAIVAFPALLKADALHADVSVACIGMGGRGLRLLRTACSLKLRVAVVCDVDEARLAAAVRLGQELGQRGMAGCKDLRRVLDRADVDAVIIATPDHWHAPAALLAMRAGKDVYLEKPASHNLVEGEWLAAEAARSGCIIQVGTQARSRPVVREAIRTARAGKIGTLRAAKAWNTQLRRNIGREADSLVPPGVDYDSWVGPAPRLPFRKNRFHYDWHWWWNFGTGDLGNDGAHQIDIARWALGVALPERVVGMGGKLHFEDDQETPDTMWVAFEYGSTAIFWEMRIWTPNPMLGLENGVSLFGTEAERRC